MKEKSAGNSKHQRFQGTKKISMSGGGGEGGGSGVHNLLCTHSTISTHLNIAHSSMHVQDGITTGTPKITVNKIPQNLHTQLLTASSFLIEAS